MTVLSNRYQTLLQSFISRRIINEQTLQEIIQLINGHYHSNSDINDYINTINTTIMELNMQIKEIRGSQARSWVLINLKADESSKLTTRYNANETTLFRLMVELILDGEGETKVSQVVDQHRQANLKMVDAEAIVNKFKEDGWIINSSQSTITLSDRAILDINPLLANLPDCHLCNQKVLMYNKQIEECQNNNCSIKLHKHCAEMLFKKTNNCPNCKQRFKQ